MTLTTLEKGQAGIIAILAATCTILWYTRTSATTQATKITANSEVQTASKAHNTSTFTTTTKTTRKADGEIVVEKVKVISKIADKETITKEQSKVTSDSSSTTPGDVQTQPSRYSLGVEFTPHLSASKPLEPANINLGVRVISGLWATSTITLESNPKITLGVRWEF